MKNTSSAPHTGASLPHYAVMGNPITHSLSPKIHQHFALQVGRPLTYEARHVPINAFAQTVSDFFKTGAGLNITLPFKQVAFSLCRHTRTQATHCHAVNTLWMQRGELWGESTDGPGLVNDLTQRAKLTLAGTHIVIAGAGGTAASVLPRLLAEKPARITLCNRTRARAEALIAHVADLAARYHTTLNVSDYACIPQPIDVLINATSLSLQSTALPLAPQCLAQCQVYYDCVYGKAAAPVLAQMREAGVKTVLDGLGMLVEQAALSFALWHGVLPETAPVLAALRLSE